MTGEEAAAAAQNAVGTISNSVTDVQFAGDTLTVTYRDGQSETFTIATGGGAGVDQDARDLAAAAQQAAESAATAAGNAQQEASNAHTAADNALAATVTNADAINALPPPGTAPATWAEVGNDIEPWAQGTGDIPYSAFDSVVESWAIKDSTPPLEIIPDGRLPVARLLPAVTGTDDGKVAKVVSGAWAVGNDNTGGAKPGFSGGLANLTGLASAAGFVNITSGLVAG